MDSKEKRKSANIIRLYVCKPLVCLICIHTGRGGCPLTFCIHTEDSVKSTLTDAYAPRRQTHLNDVIMCTTVCWLTGKRGSNAAEGLER